jgi:hypothetical protein
MLAVMSGAWIVLASLLLGPPPPEISEPPGIEFAPAPTLDADTLPIEVPPPPEGVEEGPVAPPPDEASMWPDPGTAPSDGSGLFVSAGVMVAAGVLVPLGLLQDPALSADDRGAIIGAGVGMEVIAALGLGLAVSRRMKLVRWAGAYRVQPTRQGAGLLTFGGIALSAGATLVPLGFWIMGRGGSSPQATAMVIGGAASWGSHRWGWGWAAATERRTSRRAGGSADRCRRSPSRRACSCCRVGSVSRSRGSSDRAGR